MNRKKIIPTTILFIVIVAVVVAFKSLFGSINTLVGVAGLTAALSLLGTDYTINPIKSTIFFVGIEVLLGICSFLSSTNAFIGLVITFAIIFFILYQFTYNTKKPTYVAFALGYFFMLFTPVSLSELPTRLISLAFCGLAIMAVQMLANRNKIQKQSKMVINKAISTINKQITLILESDCSDKCSELNATTDKTIKNFNIGVYERLDNKINIPVSLDHTLFISKFLENINIMIGEIDASSLNSEYNIVLKNLEALLNNIDVFVSNNNDDIDTLIGKLNDFSSSSDNNSLKTYLSYKLEYYVNLLKDDLLLTKESISKRMSKEHSFSSIATNFSKLKYNLSRDSLKFTFALRGALITSIGVFIVFLFDIPQGKWLVFSLLLVAQPYLESSKAKGRDRVIGTIIGLIIFEILFTIVTDNTLRALIILLTGYISNYQTKYKYQMTCTTISSLGAASIGSNINDLGFLRISLVLIGTLIALYANRVILPYSMVDTTKREIKKSITLNKKILSMLYEIGLVKGKFNDDVRLAVTNNLLINTKIEFNNSTLLSKDIDKFVYNQRVFFHKLHFLITNSKNYRSEEAHDFNLFYDIDTTLSKDIDPDEIIKILNRNRGVHSKLILIDALELKHNLKMSVDLSESIYKEL